MSKVSLEELIKQGEPFNDNPTRRDGGKWCLNFKYLKNFFEWEKTSLMYLQSEYPNHPQTSDFKNHINIDAQRALLTTYQSLIGILKAFSTIEPSNNIENYKNADIVLADIFNNFNRFVNQLKRKRYNNRERFISDEYDVQDLLYAVLMLHFNDVRQEVWTPQYAGSSNRIDFFINDCHTAIEVKIAKENHTEKQIGDELLIDISKYSVYPNCQSLYCFVYDPDCNIENPKGFEDDLNKKASDGFIVKAFVRPWQ